jgi:hypothetical protein
MMSHQLQFQADCKLNLLLPNSRKLQKVLVEQGNVIEAGVFPYIQEAEEGPVEVADLCLDQIGVLLAVRMACFRFVETSEEWEH